MQIDFGIFIEFQSLSVYDEEKNKLVGSFEIRNPEKYHEMATPLSERQVSV